MQLKQLRRAGSAGHIMLVTLLVCVIMGMTLASYLIMAGSQNKSVVRSQSWNSALPMAEAGVDEALQLLNKYAGRTDNMITNWPSTAVPADHWTVSGNMFYVWRHVDGSWYYTSVYNTHPTPTIRSIGYVLWRDPDNYSLWLTREIQVRTRLEPLWSVAMAAKEIIDFSGKNVRTDSFDSSDPNFSNNGLYPYGMLSKTKDNGDVVTDLTIIDSLSVGNAKIKGKAKTGPEGTIDIGPTGSVGSKSWVESGKTGIEDGWGSDDMNVVFNDVILPDATWLDPLSTQINQSINGVTYQYVFLNNGDYVLGDVTGGIYVSNAVVRLLVNGNIAVAGGDAIRIVSGKVSLYMAGTSASILGNGVVNETGLAENFFYFGLPSNTQISFGGNGTFVGAIYAPQAHFSLGGGGNSTYDFIGSSVTRSVKMNGHFNFHYDEALRNRGPARGYIPTSWREY